MHIAVLGDWKWPIYEAALSSALAANGAITTEIRLDPTVGTRGRIGMKWSALSLGHTPHRCANAVAEAIRKLGPFDWLFCYRTPYMTPDTVALLREASPNMRLAYYHNDNPFAPEARVWGRHIRNAAALFDVVFAYRPSNVIDYMRRGCSRVHLLPPAATLSAHSEAASAEVDAVFVGHYEPDGRASVLRALHESGLRVAVYGTRWPPRIGFDTHPPAYGDEYLRALRSAKCALAFLSARNRDVYTRRNLEIPAAGVIMVGQWSSELSLLFRPREEAFFFHDEQSAVRTVTEVITLPDDGRRAILDSARRRLQTLGMDDISQARRVLQVLHAAKGQ